MPRIPLWIDLRHVPADQREPWLAAAQNARCEQILVPADDPLAQRPDAIAVDGTLLLRNGSPIGAIRPVIDAATQQAAIDADGIVIVDADEWTIIPLENLIAAREDRPGTVFGIATDPAQAGVFRDTLDRGVHGVVLRPDSPDAIRDANEVLSAKGLPAEAVAHAFEIRLVPATITSIQDGGPGDRVCVDTTSILEPGEGLLVGSTARSFVLVHGETIETEFVRARPFRINAGAVHSYLMGPDGRTQYLSEVAAGSQVLAVSQIGTRPLSVGRAKIEHRPHFLIKWQGEGGNGSAVLQNAETIRLVRPDGTPVSITAVHVGDEILVHHESKARHFGMPVDERLEER